MKQKQFHSPCLSPLGMQLLMCPLKYLHRICECWEYQKGASCPPNIKDHCPCIINLVSFTQCHKERWHWVVATLLLFQVSLAAGGRNSSLSPSLFSIFPLSKLYVTNWDNQINTQVVWYYTSWPETKSYEDQRVTETE